MDGGALTDRLATQLPKRLEATLTDTYSVEALGMVTTVHIFTVIWWVMTSLGRRFARCILADHGTTPSLPIGRQASTGLPEKP